ncbi:MAG: bifunctional metallophosphatase/5'-nucleotidase [Chloroflexota bacterium]|nr:bifunctional metallophosphatase/5'-nucleotidase [Chloroflexota bacterium]MDE2959359.1 bifunctional metallophosphatase/5'-nucleotidase [Chloroflexota bacterium]
MALLVVISCGGDSGAGERAELQNAVAALQQDIIALRTDFAARPVARDASDRKGSHQETSPRVEQLEREIAELTEALRQHTERLRLLESRTAAPVAPEAEPKTFTLQLLHAADMDSAVGALENVENFSAILEGFRAQFPNNTLVLSSGDNYVRGPRYYAAGDDSLNPALGIAGNGRGDIAFLNAMGFQASALGNHELDLGTGPFASAIGSETNDGGLYPGAMFPYLSSNLDFTNDENLKDLVVSDGQEAMLVGGSLARSAVITVDGRRIGIVGATTPYLASITGTGGIAVIPNDGADLDALAAVIQDAVDELVGQGINKVILLAHMQRIDVEQALATRLSDVDIIVAGGSNALLADSTDRLRDGDTAIDTYPLLYRAADDAPVLLVNTDGDYKYLGRLVVQFDDGGHVIPGSIDPYLSGAYSTDRQGAQAFAGQPVSEVSRVAEALRGILAVRDGNIIARTDVYLDGRRGTVRTQESNLGNLAADSILWAARRVDPEVRVSLRNGGGIRDDIGLVVQSPGATDRADVQFLPPPANPATGKLRGDVSQFDIEGSLRFDNGLVIIPLTARQLVEILEHTVGAHGVGEVPSGGFPQVGGMRFSFNPAAPSGQRIRSLALIDDSGNVADRVVENGKLTGDPEREIKTVTLNFLANGGSGYPFPVPHPGRVDFSGEAGQNNPHDADFPDANANGVIDGPTADADPGRSDAFAIGKEQDALAEYLAHFHAVTPFSQPETAPLDDQRIQNLSIPGKADTVFD